MSAAPTHKSVCSAGEALVRTLVAAGVDTAFAVSGESFLSVLNGLRLHQNAIRLIISRAEGGGAFAAEAYGKLTGRPAAVFVSRGPGASNAAIGIHTARQDSTPLLLFIGHVRSHSKGREAFQEVDHHQMFGALAKAVLEPARAADIPDITAQAIELSVNGRPGPVVVILPRDLTETELLEPTIPTARPASPLLGTGNGLQAIAARLKAAKRPLIVAGEMIAQEKAHAELQALADAALCPVLTAYRRQDLMDNCSAAYAGHLDINRLDYQRRAFAETDLVLFAGSRLDGITGEDGNLLRPGLDFIQIYPDAEVLSRFRASLSLQAHIRPSLAALTDYFTEPVTSRNADWRDRLHEAYLAASEPQSVTCHGAVNLAEIAAALPDFAPPGSVIVTDGGSFARWIHRFYRFRRPGTSLGPISGAMGYAVPGAIGAVTACMRESAEDTPVLAFVGDGGFMMTGQELAAAVEYDLPIKVIVCDNGAHGSILEGQRQHYGADNLFGTHLQSPDFTALGKAYGAASLRVEATREFGPALVEALAYPGPALLHLITDQRDIAPSTALKDAV